MRVAVMLAAVAALWIQPAQAVTFQISGVATGTISGTEPCETDVYCFVEKPWMTEFSFTPAEYFQVADIFTFTHGAGSNSGVFGGQFRSLGGNLYQAIFDYFEQTTAGCGIGITPECSRIATTSEFSVIDLDAPAVPEPATWVMMLLGFGAIGYGMRRVRTAPSSDRQTSSYSPLPASLARGAYQPWLA